MRGCAWVGLCGSGKETGGVVVVVVVFGSLSARESEWNLTDKLKKRASVMKSVPHCLKGPFRNALQLALEEASSDDVVRQDRGWKLFLLIPRMLLHQPLRGGLIPKEKLRERFDVLARGEWNTLLEASSKCDEEAAARRKRR